MLVFLTNLLLIVRSRLRCQLRLQAEILVLRRQVLILGRKSSSRVRLRNLDRLILVWLFRIFPALLDAITVVKPETVIRWHRRGFRAYWRGSSKPHPLIDRLSTRCTARKPSTPTQKDANSKLCRPLAPSCP